MDYGWPDAVCVQTHVGVRQHGYLGRQGLRSRPCQYENCGGKVIVVGQDSQAYCQAVSNHGELIAPKQTLDNWSARLAAYRPRRLPGRQLVTRCGVVILVAERGESTALGKESGPALLMMRRAERVGDPWSGDMSFPGGKQDPSDVDTRSAALRELAEETGFKVNARTAPIGRLSDRLTREHGRNRPMVVSPYVYRTPRAVRLVPGIEASALVWCGCM